MRPSKPTQVQRRQGSSGRPGSRRPAGTAITLRELLRVKMPLLMGLQKAGDVAHD